MFGQDPKNPAGGEDAKTQDPVAAGSDTAPVGAPSLVSDPVSPSPSGAAGAPGSADTLSSTPPSEAAMPDLPSAPAASDAGQDKVMEALKRIEDALARIEAKGSTNG